MAHSTRPARRHPQVRIGRTSGLPVYVLLGGAYRDRIPLSVSLADPDFAADLDLLAKVRAEGVGIVKVKTGVKRDGTLVACHYPGEITPADC